MNKSKIIGTHFHEFQVRLTALSRTRRITFQIVSSTYIHETTLAERQPAAVLNAIHLRCKVELISLHYGNCI